MSMSASRVSFFIELFCKRLPSDLGLALLRSLLLGDSRFGLSLVRKGARKTTVFSCSPQRPPRAARGRTRGRLDRALQLGEPRLRRSRLLHRLDTLRRTHVFQPLVITGERWCFLSLLGAFPLNTCIYVYLRVFTCIYNDTCIQVYLRCIKSVSMCMSRMTVSKWYSVYQKCI
jgi:hypothetical protein